MEIFLAFLRIIYVIIFFSAVFTYLKFEMREEGKDERGKSIANKSYGIVFPLIPFGWFLIFLYDEFINQFSYEAYKLAIWFLITGLIILHAIIISVLKRQY